MTSPARRIRQSRELGRAHRGFDLLLGTSALIPILVCAAIVWLAPAVSLQIVRTVAVIWSACLLAFFAGVRRGLTFSEAGGGEPAELVTMLGLFAIAVVSLLLLSPVTAAVGLAAVGVLDSASARRREAPDYFVVFRPPQMLAAVTALLMVQFHHA